MMFTAIDSVFLSADDPDAAALPYERLGLKLTRDPDGGRRLVVGAPGEEFALRFRSGLPAPIAVALRAEDVRRSADQLASRGVPSSPYRDGDEDMAWLSLHDAAGSDVVLVNGPRPMPPDHDFPLRRLDHLAAVTHDLDAKCVIWTDILGVRVAGEVTTPTLIIRQLRIGGAVLELLGPASTESPIWSRSPGLVGMASWEVPDLDAAVTHARARGFTVTDPATGVLPGTRIATVQGTELAGVNMQLLQYV